MSRLAFTILVLGTCAAGATAQTPPSEIQLLRDASAREVAGDLRGSENILKDLLAKNPQSLSGILSLERVLKMQGRLKELVPVIEQLLKVEPESPIGHQLLVRAYASIDDVAELRAAADTWIKATPKLEKPYREIALVWQNRGDYARAVQYLENGRDRIGRPDALALELGDLYAAMEETSRAVREWERAIGPEARGFMLVQRRLAGLSDGGAQILPRLIDALLKSPTTMPRRKAAAQLAIDAGLEDRAEEIARAAYAALIAPQERTNFLVEIARRSDGAQLNRLAHWAYSELVKLGGATEQMLALRGRVAELSLALGDTLAAAATYRTLESAYAPGSPERRQAAALRIQLTAHEGKLADATAELQAFRRDYPEAPELDAIASALANGLLESGDLDQAEAALTGMNGARSNLIRSRIALRRGDIPRAKAALLAAAPSLRGAEATDAIKLATVLGRVSNQGGELMGQALSRVSSGAPAEAVGMLLNGARSLPGNEPAAILEMAAAIADRNHLAAEAERARRTIIKDFAAAPEAPAALLSLAQSLSQRTETMGEAREHLERLILEHPRSALVPQARQQLDLLQGRIPRS